MDKTGKIVIAICFALIIFWTPLQNLLWPPKPIPLLPRTAGTNAVSAAVQPRPSHPGTAMAEPSALVTQLQGIAKRPFGTAVMENDDVIVHLSGEGGGIKEVIFKKFDVKDEPPAAINNQAPTSAFDLANIGGLQFGDEFKIEQAAGGRKVTARRETPEVSVVKTYWLEEDYRLKAEIKLVNKTQKIISSGELKPPVMCVGTASPLSHLDRGDNLGFGWLTEAGKYAKGALYNVIEKPWYSFLVTQPPRFKSFSQEVRAQWIALNNQFFAMVVTPDAVPIVGIHADAVPINKSNLPYARSDQKGILVLVDIGMAALAPGETRTLNFTVYTGPRDFHRLEALGQKQGYVMDYGMWAYFCKLLLGMMIWFHGRLGNWGLAIIAMTTVIKVIFWPLTNASTRSMKRMQVLAPKMKEIQEKYRDDHQKLQKETWKLYSDYGMTPLSPLGGCLPMVVQIPIFFALFSMLRSTVQLRGAEFLWIKDLSMPDTILHLGAIPVNPMPLLMVVAQIWQMKIMPSTTTDPSQKMMMWMMPMVFLLICYNFASALALYWTVQTLLQAVQTYLIKNRPGEPLQKVKRPKFQGLTFGRPVGEKKRK